MSISSLMVHQACHTNVVIKYVSANDISHDKAMLEEQWKNIKKLPVNQKMPSIIPTKDGKVTAAEILTVHSFCKCFTVIPK